MRKAIFGAMVAGLISLGAASAVSAQDWSIGAGGVFSSNFGGGYVHEKEYPANLWRYYKSEVPNPYSGVGADVFFAAKYAEASVGFLFTKHEWKPSYRWKTSATKEKKEEVRKEPDTSSSVSAISINLGLWLKYPYELSDAVKIFPMMGIDYELCGSISSVKYGTKMEYRNKIEAGMDANNLSRTWFKAGVGGDIGLGERVFLHPVVLYGVGWKNSMERNVAKELGREIDVRLSHGFTTRVGVGYRFDID